MEPGSCRRGGSSPDGAATGLKSRIISAQTSEDLKRLTEIESAIVNATDFSVNLKTTKLTGTDISY